MRRRELKEPSESIVALAVLWSPAFGEAEALREVAQAFGPFDQRTEAFVFGDVTSYYEREMGPGLLKCFVALSGRRPRASLPKLKHLAAELEARHLAPEGGGRLLNVDPMLVSLENVVVASSKNFPHRVYLGSGVFGDLQLIRRRAGFEACAWTYADYVAQRTFFEKLHECLRSGSP